MKILHLKYKIYRVYRINVACSCSTYGCNCLYLTFYFYYRIWKTNVDSFPIKELKHKGFSWKLILIGFFWEEGVKEYILDIVGPDP